MRVQVLKRDSSDVWCLHKRTISGYDAVSQYGSFFVDYIFILKYNTHTDKL